MNKTTLKFWLLKTPMFFALRAFLAVIALTTLGKVISQVTSDAHLPMLVGTIGMLIVLSLVMIAIKTIRRIPVKKIDRTSFVTLYNTQAILSCVLGLAFSIFAMPFMVFRSTPDVIGIPGLFIAALFFICFLFYAWGLSLTALWSSFLRARTLNIPTWKIICSYPFGFGMLWIPGYFIPNKKDRTPIITTEKKWVANLTTWTMTSTKNAALLLTVLFIIPGIFNGASALLPTICTLMLFAIWIMQTGAKKFEKNIGGAYATTAVIINIAMLTYTIIVATYLI